jgi:tripartite ATP-independent transporter DctM subunit
MSAIVPIIILLFLLTIFGAPLFVVILAVALIGFYALGIDLSVIAIEIYRLADTPLLVALPLFTFAGYLMAKSHTSERLVQLTRVFLGWMPGGLAIVTLVACAVFTAFTGASGVTIVALGALLYPAMVQDGYREQFSLGLVTTSGSLGLLFPPSLPLILYGVIAQQISTGQGFTLEDLFWGGLLPGSLMVALLSGWTLWSNRRIHTQRTRFSIQSAIRALRESAWEIPLPIFLVGGIYGGFVAVSEAAAVSALYVLVVEVFVYKEIRPAQLFGYMRDSMVMVGGILLILAVSLATTNLLIDAGVPAKLLDLMQVYVQSKTAFLILLNVMLLAVGAILDIFSALVIMVPIILPVALSYGVDPVHLGIVFLANMQIGYMTPPVGMNLFIASYRFEKNVSDIYSAALPFMIVLLIALLVITYIPGLTLLFRS